MWNNQRVRYWGRLRLLSSMINVEVWGPTAKFVCEWQRQRYYFPCCSDVAEWLGLVDIVVGCVAWMRGWLHRGKKTGASRLGTTYTTGFRKWLQSERATKSCTTECMRARDILNENLEFLKCWDINWAHSLRPLCPFWMIYLSFKGKPTVG